MGSSYNGSTAEWHSTNRGSIPRGSTILFFIIGVWYNGITPGSDPVDGSSILSALANLWRTPTIKSAAYFILTPQTWRISRVLSSPEDHDRLSPA